MAAHLDALSPEERVRQMTAAGKALQKRLWSCAPMRRR